MFLCLHAVGGSHLHWLGVAPRLARRGHVLAPDLLGFGRTARGSLGSTLEAQRALVSALLEQTGPAVLIGSSFGGCLALLQAAETPESVQGVILTGSLLPPFRDGMPPTPDFSGYVRHRARQRVRGALRRRPLTLDRGVLVADGLRSVVADPSTLDSAIVEASAALAREGHPRELMRGMLETGRSTFRLLSRPERFARVLDRVACPVLVVHGRRDRTIPVEFALAAARLHPDWRLRVFEDLGHLPHLENQSGWLEAVGEWLDDVFQNGREGGAYTREPA